MNNTLINQDENLQPLIGGESLPANDLSFILNQDLCINTNETPYSENKETEPPTTAQLNSDNYIGEFLSDEDFQIALSNLHPSIPEDLAEASGVNVNIELSSEDRIEVSSDSAISSMSRSVS